MIGFLVRGRVRIRIRIRVRVRVILTHLKRCSFGYGVYPIIGHLNFLLSRSFRFTI